MTDIITTSVRRTDPDTVIDRELEAAIEKADPQALVAAILQAGIRLSDRDVDGIESLAATAAKVVKGPALPALLGIAHQIDPHSHVVTEGQAIWTMDWSQRDADGIRRYPEKPETEQVFEHPQGLALLLINEVVHLNSHHWEDSWPKDARETVHLGVDCSDVFAWGCSDSEDATYKDIEEVYRHWLKDPRWGGAVWSMVRRRQMPQRPVEKRIRDAGVWNLDALRAEHGLRPNHYDGVSGVQAGQKYEAYCAWERENGVEPLPYDATWWEGWRRYVAVHPDWHDAAWKAEEERRRTAWRMANGYEDMGIVETVLETIDIKGEIERLANMVQAAADRRAAAATLGDGFSKSYLQQSAATTEREVLASLPAVLAAISRGSAS